MKSVYNFVVTPKGERYNNKKKVGDSELILNTDIYRHEFVNRIAIVKSVPLIGDTDIKPGDEVIVHHNVFRRWHNVKGIEDIRPEKITDEQLEKVQSVINEKISG